MLSLIVYPSVVYRLTARRWTCPLDGWLDIFHGHIILHVYEDWAIALDDELRLYGRFIRFFKRIDYLK